VHILGLIASEYPERQALGKDSMHLAIKWHLLEDTKELVMVVTVPYEFYEFIFVGVLVVVQSRRVDPICASPDILLWWLLLVPPPISKSWRRARNVRPCIRRRTRIRP
jgi:hypothetical protein